ncbi:hypothetical protein [Flavobacterium hibernum]|uniref:Uncharacterized protein n=1 Tax=Flavobacterium hibernum TaxID=37752 RepID=A0A0D0EJC6_9FLAO|nr:hypothetical protein [Flavobacterium hibernum]KIO50940.1 hypothetical protein IW18_20335 [Flavobacterium hibernum]OXA85180.1 hypothetical protein B0A73_17675 [Flavobacterium hibernum]STO19556.1 Uncharacterised protein [Flavobacterium hibernum]
MDILINIVIAFVCGLVPTLLTLYLNERVKLSVKNSFDEKLEVLKKEHSKEISQFQSELNHLKSKENFKFTKLHEIRLKVLARTHHILNDNMQLLQDFISPTKIIPEGKTVEMYEKEFSLRYKEKHNKFIRYFNHYAIYFSEDLEKLIREYVASSAKVFDIYDRKVHFPKSDDQILQEAYSVYSKMPLEIYPLKKQIETKFRELLGE